MKRMPEEAPIRRQSDLSRISTILPGLDLPVTLRADKTKKRSASNAIRKGKKKEPVSPKQRDYAKEKQLARIGPQCLFVRRLRHGRNRTGLSALP